MSKQAILLNFCRLNSPHGVVSCDDSVQGMTSALSITSEHTEFIVRKGCRYAPRSIRKLCGPVCRYWCLMHPTSVGIEKNPNAHRSVEHELDPLFDFMARDICESTLCSFILHKATIM